MRHVGPLLVDPSSQVLQLLYIATGHSLWLHFGVDDIFLPPILTFTRGFLGFDPQPRFSL